MIERGFVPGRYETCALLLPDESAGPHSCIKPNDRYHDVHRCSCHHIWSQA